MRKINWRLVITGIVFIVLDIGFILFMMSLAPSSTDPVTLMETAGSAAGVFGVVSIIMIIFGFIGKKS